MTGVGDGRGFPKRADRPGDVPLTEEGPAKTVARLGCVPISCDGEAQLVNRAGNVAVLE